MKRVSVIVIHDSYKSIKTMAIRYNQSGTLVNLLSATVKSYKFECFNDLYKFVLVTLKNNNMYAKYWESFNLKWYDIQWINEKYPTNIESFGYSENVIQRKLATF